MIPRTYIDFSRTKEGKASFIKFRCRVDTIYNQLKNKVDIQMLNKLGEELYDEYLHDVAWNQACEEFGL